MSSGGGGFLDNPFGGLFDVNGDGKEDFLEQFLGYKMFEDICEDGNDSLDDDLLRDDFDEDDIDIDFDDPLRNDYDDSCDYGIDSDDYD